MQMLSLLFFVIGSLIGASHMGWWTVNFITGAPASSCPTYSAGSAPSWCSCCSLPRYFAAEKYEKKSVWASPTTSDFASAISLFTNQFILGGLYNG